MNIELGLLCIALAAMLSYHGSPDRAHTGHGDQIPEAALQPGAIPDSLHPFTAKINRFLALAPPPEDFKPTRLNRGDYSKIIEGQVRAMLSLELYGKGVRFSLLEPDNLKLTRTGKQLNHRNGIVEAVYAEFRGSRIRYQFQAE